MGGIIVVSDTHFGYEKSDHTEFEHFLDALKGGKLKAHLFGDKVKEIKDPESIILLGDILDIWDPKSDERKNILKDAVSSLRKLSEFDSEIIYVTGNHDEEMQMYEGEYSGNIKIKSRHYSELKREEKLTKGKHSYFFMHGHQFDKTFRFLGSLWKLPGWMSSWNASWQRIPIPYLREFCSIGLVSMLILCIIDKFILKISFPKYLYLLFIPFALIGIPRIWTQFQRPFHKACNKIIKKVSSFIEKTRYPKVIPFIVVFIGVIFYLLYKNPEKTIFKYLLIILTPLLLYQFLIYNPVFEFLKKHCQGKSKYKEISEIIDQRFYKSELDTIKEDVIVFGHTHRPGRESKRAEYGKIFINTGSWTKNEEYEYDTLVYIDESGHYLLKWDKENKAVKELIAKI